MVFSLPGVGGGGDVGGGGHSWDRNEGEGDWQKASEEQKNRVKRLMAKNHISKMSDVEEDPELFDKETGKKLTFNFPDVQPASFSRGRGRGKRTSNGNAGVRNRVEKTDDEGMEIYDEPKGEKEKNPPLEDSYEKERNENKILKRLADWNSKGDKEPPAHSRRRIGQDPGKGSKKTEKTEEGEEKEEIEDEKKRKARQMAIVERILIKRKQINKDINNDKPTGEKEKKQKENPVEIKLEDDDEDLFDTNFEDMEVVHTFPTKKGGPPPQQKCQYELIRDQIVADREALMKAVLADIRKTSREIVEDNEKYKKRKASDHGKAKKEKKRKVEKVVDIEGARRSARERKPVNYCALEDEDDPDWQPGERKKKVERKRKRKDGLNNHIQDRKPLPPGWNPKWNHIHNPFEKKDRDKEGEASASGKNGGKAADSAEAGRRSMREKRYVNYNSDEPRADEFVFCDKCGEDKYHGCELHPLIFDYVAHFDVGPSKVGKNAGRGVFNNDPRGDIPEAVMFGPYSGTFYTVEEYEILKRTRGESGYAWELTDHDKIKVIGYVDPGPDPDPHKQWMSIVNCASKTRHQNLMPGQFIGGIYYRSVEIIKYGEELLTYYGNDYARDIKINVAERDVYELDEDWEEEGVSCPHCGNGFVKEVYLQKHIDMVDGAGNGGCKVLRREKNRAEVLAGLRPFVCGECGWGCKTAWELNKQHKNTHIDAKPFICPECGKTYKRKYALDRHYKAEHEGQRFDCPDCERPFKYKNDMMMHWKNVCNREDQEYKCCQCGKKFNKNYNLTRHIMQVHNRALPHKCEVCDRRFGLKQNLQSHHLAVHTDARPHVCEDCGATFKYAQKLDHHRIRDHTRQWYWNCEVCDKEDIEMGFLLPYELKKHMLLHHPTEYKEQIENEKPAVCLKCQKRFPSEEQVKIHLKKMHNESLTKNF